MPLDTSIYNPLLNMPNWAQNAGNALAQGYQLGTAIKEAPIRNRLLEAQAQSAEQGNNEDLLRMQYKELTADWPALKNALETGDMTRANQLVGERIGRIQKRGGDPSDTIRFWGGIASGEISPQEAIADMDAAIAGAERAGFIGSGQARSVASIDRQELLKTIQPALDENGNFDPKKATAEQLSAARELDIIPKLGTLASAERVATTPGMTEAVAGSESVIAGAKSGASERSKLIEQKNLRPQIEAAVTSAKAFAEQEADAVAANKSNDKAMQIYDAAINNMFEKLGVAWTGPGAGWLPAMTKDARIAEGAIAVMAPVLKSLFRVSGEGTFTKDDQDRLMAMLPSRNDSNEVAAAKLDAVDLVVRAQLGQGRASRTFTEKSQGAKKEGGQIMIDANGNRAMVYPDGSYEEM